MECLSLPLVSKWACIFSAKARARYLDFMKLYADGSFDKYPYASICLDAPLILLQPEHPDSNRTRPSNIAQACDLFPDPGCYKFMRMIEDDIIGRGLFKATNPIFYAIAEVDSLYSPTRLFTADYGEALAQLRDLHVSAPIPATP